jgi:hypothetical protein
LNTKASGFDFSKSESSSESWSVIISDGLASDSWSKGLNEKVIACGLAQGCEAVVIGAFIDTAYTARDGSERTAKELVINRLTVLDWAEDRHSDAADDRAAA